MKRTLLSLSALAALGSLPTASHADLSFNIGGVSDYRYRGISQTRLDPALQAGMDFGEGGFYLGTWASQIKWVKDAYGEASLEVDLYGGYKGDIIKDSLTYDVGLCSTSTPVLSPRPGARPTRTRTRPRSTAR